MARPVWSGVLTFGLVTLPVALYTATEDHTVHFHQLQRDTSDRVRNKRVNERTGKEVPYEEIVKGYEVRPGEYVVVEPQELEDIAPGRSRTIDIAGFVDLGEVEPIFFDRTYYLGPKGEEYAKIYKLLTDALERSNRAGLALFSMRGKEYLTAVRAEQGLLELHTMRFADEIRDPRAEIGSLPDSHTRVSKQELDTAQQLIEMMAIEWKPAEWHDTYAEQVRKLVKDKAAGREIAVAQGPEEPTNVVDLMDALKQSLETTRRARGGAKDGQDDTGARRSSRSAEKVQLSELTKAELYQRATELGVAGRSAMTRDELEDAVRKASRSGGGRRAAA